MPNFMKVIKKVGIGNSFNHDSNRWKKHYTAHLECGHTVGVSSNRKLGSKTHCSWCKHLSTKSALAG